MRRLSCLLVSFTLLSGTAYAQNDAASLSDRLDRLERDVNFVQKQVYRNGAGGDGNSAPITNNGQVQVRFSQIDEEIRQIRGLIEQSQFQNKQNADALKKLSDDVDYRLKAIEQKQAEAAVNAAAAAPVAAPASPVPAIPATPDAPAKPAAYTPASAAASPTGKDFPDSNAHYSHAFKLLNEKKYAEAAQSFDAFVKKYPADPLTANAYYWLGESQYARGDFTRATESFRKGFEANPEAQKAPDNLLKLGMSLGQIKRKQEACIVFQQIESKYSESAARTVAKAQEAATALQCK